MKLDYRRDSRRDLEFLGLPSTDHSMPEDSNKTFSDGSHFGIEVSSCNTPETLSAMLDFAAERQLRIDRFMECRGISRLTDSDIKAMATLCHQAGAGLYLSIGARAIYATGAFVRSKNGVRQGYRMVGSEQLCQGLEEIRRAYDLGIRGFLVYDEGFLDVVGRLRSDGRLPADIQLKFSVHAGCSNPASASLLRRLGADCINPVPDLSIAALAGLRNVVDCPLDVFSDTAGDAGGLVRTHEVTDFIEKASPVYLKCGPVSQPHQNHLPDERELKERIRQTACVVEEIQRNGSHLKRVTKEEPTLALTRAEEPAPVS